MTLRRGLTIALLIVLFASSCGSRPSSDATPGFSGDVPAAGTEPFQMAAPSEHSTATTLPDEFFDPETEGRETNSSSPAGVSGFTTTPTTPTLSRPLAPALASIKDICGFTMHVSSFFRFTELGPVEAEQAATQLLAALDRWIDVAPPGAKADLVELRSVLQDPLGLLRSAGWNTADGVFRERIADLATGSNGAPSATDIIGSISRAETAACD